MGWGGKPTINDVAREAGVSNATVSYVLSGKGSVGQNTRERILKVVDKLGYQPDHIARTMKMGRTDTIGLIVPNLVDRFLIQIVRDVERITREQGKCIFLVNIDDQPDNLSSGIARLIKHRAGGILLCDDGQVPIALLEEANIPSLVLENVAGEFEAVPIEERDDYTKALVQEALEKLSDRMKRPVHATS